MKIRRELASPWWNLGKEFYADKPADAAECFKRSLQAYGEDLPEEPTPSYWTVITTLMAAGHGLDDLLELCEQLRAQRPRDSEDHRDAVLGCGVLMRAEGKHEAAAQLLEPYSEEFKSSVNFVILRIALLHAIGETQRAAELYQELSARVDGYNRACLCSIRGDYTGARTALTDVVTTANRGTLAWAQVDPDLAPIRHLDWFAELFDRRWAEIGGAAQPD